MSSPVWSLDRVSLKGHARARLDAVTLQIPQGITAVMGCSGAGKSSLLSLLAGFEKPESGTAIFYSPLDIRPTPDRLPLFWSPQDHGLWPHLTAIEHLVQVLPGTLERTVCEEWLEGFGLQSICDRLPAELSQGERSRLSVARSLASGASALVLDEPLVHVDAVHLDEYWRVIERHVHTHGTSIVFSTHHPATVLRFARHVICLDEGRVTYSGAVAELYHNPPVREPAWLLGPCNWLPEDLSSFFDDDKPDDNRPRLMDVSQGVRPERLVVESDENGLLEVVSVTPIGGLVELQVQSVANDGSVPFRLFASSSNVRLGAGPQARISVLPPEPRHSSRGKE
jgi:iron(III) transport system ATP-binding protein